MWRLPGGLAEMTLMIWEKRKQNGRVWERFSGRVPEGGSECLERDSEPIRGDGPNGGVHQYVKV